MAETENRWSRWTRKRVARLGFLIGIGWGAKRIAGDNIVSATEGNIYRQATKLGLSFRNAAEMAEEMPDDVMATLRSAAARRGISPQQLAERILLTVGADEMPGPNDQAIGGHCTYFPAYGQKPGYITGRNSWDTDWGDKGDFYLPEAFLEQQGSDFWIITKVSLA